MITIAYKTVLYGSSGEDVKKLQEKLNSKGYSLQVDGKFGTKTQAAVKDYQKKQGLSVDGIVGNNTWSALHSVSDETDNKNTIKNSLSSTEKVYSVPKPKYQKSDSVSSAEKKLSDWENNKPAEYKSSYSDDIDRILNDILNRNDFNYDLSSDPMYEQYKELYLMNGKKAMMDAVGNSTALTGGYGNSYAQTVGDLAYDEYLTQLNDIALDLRDRAFDEYESEGDRLVENISLLRSLDGDDYEKYLGELERYYEDGAYLLEKLSNMSDSEFEAYVSQLNSWESDRAFAFEEYKDKLDREQFEKEMSFKKSEAQRDQSNKDREYALAKQKASSGSGGGSSSSSEKEKESKTGVVTLYPTTYKEFYARTGVSSILTEDEFNASKAYKSAYKDGYRAYLKAMYNKYK